MADTDTLQSIRPVIDVVRSPVDGVILLLILYYFMYHRCISVIGRQIAGGQR